MKRLPRGVKVQVMGTRSFDTMYTAKQLRKAVADEREECAKVCDAVAEEMEVYGEGPTGYISYVEDCAAAIRARGNT